MPEQFPTNKSARARQDAPPYRPAAPPPDRPPERVQGSPGPTFGDPQPPPQGVQRNTVSFARPVVRGILFSLAAIFIVAFPAGIIGAIVEGVAEVYSGNGSAWGLSAFGMILLGAGLMGFFLGYDR